MFILWFSNSTSYRAQQGQKSKWGQWEAGSKELDNSLMGKIKWGIFHHCSKRSCLHLIRGKTTPLNSKIISCDGGTKVTHISLHTIFWERWNNYNRWRKSNHYGLLGTAHVRVFGSMLSCHQGLPAVIPLTETATYVCRVGAWFRGKAALLAIMLANTYTCGLYPRGPWQWMTYTITHA